jgi:hypothetical protein
MEKIDARKESYKINGREMGRKYLKELNQWKKETTDGQKLHELEKNFDARNNLSLEKLSNGTIEYLQNEPGDMTEYLTGWKNHFILKIVKPQKSIK